MSRPGTRLTTVLAAVVLTLGAGSAAVAGPFDPDAEGAASAGVPGSPLDRPHGVFRASFDPACAWRVDVPTLHACWNRNSILHNDIADGDEDVVRVYWGAGYEGAWFCLEAGRQLSAAQDSGIRFDLGWDQYGHPLAGFGETVWNNAASARWADSCIGEG